MVASGVLAGLSATLLLTGHRFLAGFSALGSGAALLTGTIVAGRGGVSARPRGRVRFAERILDLIFDASILVPLAWVMRSGSNWDATLAMLGLGTAYLASYQRAKGQSLGYVGSESVGYRVTREAILVLGLLTGWVTAALWAFTVVAAAAACVRVWNVVLQERQPAAGETG
jgi:phosphatidylglycerophosphate synthase